VKLNSYCGVCKESRKSGYCRGTADAPHDPEPCPPCGNCTRKICNWHDHSGCARFTLRDVSHAKPMEVAR